MRSIILRGILAATAVLITACDTADSIAPVTPSASTNVRVSADLDNAKTNWRPVDQYVWASCANGGTGETVHVTGDIRFETQRMQDSSGVYHLSIKSNVSGLTAVGLTSGTFFRGMMAEHINSRAEDYLNSDVRGTDIVRFVAPGSGESYSLMVTSHYVVDQGNYVLWEETWTEVCR